MRRGNPLLVDQRMCEDDVRAGTIGFRWRRTREMGFGDLAILMETVPVCVERVERGVDPKDDLCFIITKIEVVDEVENGVRVTFIRDNKRGHFTSVTFDGGAWRLRLGAYPSDVVGNET